MASKLKFFIRALKEWFIVEAARPFHQTWGQLTPLTIVAMTIMGIDLGGKRVGLAVTASGILATPHSVIPNPGDDEVLAERIRQLAEGLSVRCFVLGIPRQRLSGDSFQKKYERFAEILRQKTCREVVLWDESLSTVEADRILEKAGYRWKERKAHIDMAAATVILQSYLDDLTSRQE